MAAELREPWLSVADYLALDRQSLTARYEYFVGYVRLMAGGSLNHDTIAFNVRRALYEQLRGGSCHTHGSDARVQLDQDHYRDGAKNPRLLSGGMKAPSPQRPCFLPNLQEVLI